MRMRFSIFALVLLFTPLRWCWADDATDSALYEKLEMKVNLVLEDATLGQAVNQLQDQTKANITVDWATLQAADIARNRKLTLRFTGLELSQALNILMVAFGNREVILRYSTHADVIRISTSDRLSLGTFTYIYDIRDFQDRLLQPNVVPPPPPPSTSPSGGGLFGNWADPATHTPGNITVVNHYTRQECIDMLIKTMEDNIDTDSWRDQGGATGSVRELDGMLIVTQTPENQLLIQRMLKNLRKIRAAIDRGEKPTTRPVDLLTP